jgi:hypothetical protein
MEGFIALAVFAEQMSNLQEKLRSTPDRPRSNRHDEGLRLIQNSTLAASRLVQAEDTLMARESRLSNCAARED